MKEVTNINISCSKAEELANLLGKLSSNSDHRDVSVHRRHNLNISSVPNVRKKQGKRAHGVPNTLNVLAAQTLKIASINGLGRLDKLENELEDEINYENRSPAKTRFGRFRRKGEHQLHSKVVLFFIVVLNIVDTLLVMIGLILDFHHVSLSLGAKSEMLSSFTEDLSHKYSIGENEPEILEKLLNAHIIFNVSAARENITDFASGCADFLNETAVKQNQSVYSFLLELLRASSTSLNDNVCFQPYNSDNQTFVLTNTGEVDSILTTVAHKLHYCSISILSLLVIILILKLVCFGRRFFKERMLVFDGLVTIISFVLDIVFMNEVTFFTQEQFVIILSLLFPWRVIRILNSLIAAVLDKHKLNLKILYTQKKKITRSLTETNTKMEVLHRHIEVLQCLCTSRGIGDLEVSRALSGDSSGGSQKNGPNGGLASMMALGKLAFQAADAFAPLSNGYKKNKSGNSSPGLSSRASSPYSSPIRSDFVEIQPIGDNNNAILKNQNDRDTDNTKLDDQKRETSPDYTTQHPVDSDTITVHINGSGPLKNRDSNDNSNPSLVLNELTADSASDNQLDSRL